MMRFLKLTGVWVFLFCHLGCTTIFGWSHYNIPLSSDPTGAKITIKNSKGKVVFKGVTPVTAKLPAAEKIFKKAAYTFEFSKKGYQNWMITRVASLNNIYHYNLLIYPFLLIEPFSKRKFKLDNQEIYADMIPK